MSTPLRILSVLTEITNPKDRTEASGIAPSLRAPPRLSSRVQNQQSTKMLAFSAQKNQNSTQTSSSLTSAWKADLVFFPKHMKKLNLALAPRLVLRSQHEVFSLGLLINHVIVVNAHRTVWEIPSP